MSLVTYSAHSLEIKTHRIQEVTLKICLEFGRKDEDVVFVRVVVLEGFLFLVGEIFDFIVVQKILFGMGL